MKIRSNGFTLIELMVVLAIVSLLAALAAPSFTTMMVKRSVQSAAQAFVTDIRFAQSEALRRTDTVSICSLAANSTTACSGATAAWANGWLVFWDKSDAGTIGTLDSTDEVIRVQQAPNRIATIQSGTPSSDLATITFQANGWSKSANATFTLTPSGTVPVNGTRTICISKQGRVRLLVEGASSCS